MTHHLPLQHPPPGLHTVDGDLYIHHYGDKKVQIWLRDEDKWMGDILDEPTWVTTKMQSTYKGRIHGSQKKYWMHYAPRSQLYCTADGHNICTGGHQSMHFAWAGTSDGTAVAPDQPSVAHYK
ncbi:hypothetical protein EDC04DRAFT_2614891 [Pisolithus marmoratus]|nr:hypothetical protein EDC04DRAFT_2614891 [Pisolithus marmoratus]